MTDTSSKFRFGNLVVNLADGLRRCWYRTLDLKPACGLHYSYCLNPSLYIDCAKIKTTLWEEQYCVGGTIQFDIDKWTPVIQELIPQINEHEMITQLKEDLKAAVDMAEKREAALTAAAKPQTLEEVTALQDNLNLALKELDELKSQMQK